jgi:hypothetical protein
MMIVFVILLLFSSFFIFRRSMLLRTRILWNALVVLGDLTSVRLIPAYMCRKREKLLYRLGIRHSFVRHTLEDFLTFVVNLS